MFVRFRAILRASVADRVGVHAGDLLGALRRVLREPLPHQREDRGHRHRAALRVATVNSPSSAGTASPQKSVPRGAGTAWFVFVSQA